MTSHEPRSLPYTRFFRASGTADAAIRRWVLAALAGCALLAGLLLWLKSPLSPLTNPDSHLYTNFGPTVPATYPLFILLVGLDNLVVVQILAYVVAAAILAGVTYYVTKQAWLAAALLIGLLINPEIHGFHHTIISEALFLPVLLLYLAALIALAFRSSAISFFLAAGFVGVAVTIRPISYPLLVVVLLAALIGFGGLPWRRRFFLMLGGLLIWVGIWGAERAYSNALHANRLTSLTGPHLFAKASLVDAPPIDRSGFNAMERQLADMMETRYAPVRDFLKGARSSSAYPVLLAHYEVCIQHGCSEFAKPEDGVGQARFHDAMRRVGLARLRTNISGYAELTWSEYKSLWVLNTRTHPSLAPAFDAYVASVQPVPLAPLLPELLAPTQPSKIAYLVRPAFVTIGCAMALISLGFAYAVLMRRSRDPFMIVAFLSALAVQAVFLFTALAGIGDGRYTMGMWPAMATALCFTLALLINAASRLRGNTGSV